jgi:ATP-dependent DNA helicase Q5
MTDQTQVILKTVFDHNDFKSKVQKDAVNSMMERNLDVFVIMPTGSGKSLVYQLPAVAATDKVTVVVAPLLALIKDQVEHLTKKNIVAETLNSKMKAKEKKRVMEDLMSESPQTRLLYVTPEQTGTQVFKRLLGVLVKANKLAHIVIDEAHCVSQWGHEFRPDYLKLGELREITRDIPWAALTATATSQDVREIKSKLKFRPESKIFKLPCFRQNLFYDVRFKNTADVSNLKCK